MILNGVVPVLCAGTKSNPTTTPSFRCSTPESRSKQPSTPKFPTPSGGEASTNKPRQLPREPKASDGVTSSSFLKRRLDSPRVILGPSSLQSRKSHTTRGYEDQRISEGERQAPPRRL